MKILITGSCGHIGSYLSDNVHKIKNAADFILVDNLKEFNVTHYLIQKKKII